MPTFTERLRPPARPPKASSAWAWTPIPLRLPVPDATEFNRAIVSATADLVCAYKPNLAFYEAMGMPGFKALEKTVQHIRDAAPHAIIIGDCKRGDIDSSAAAYATAMFDVWGFDAVTVNPWGGMDTVEPWLTNPSGAHSSGVAAPIAAPPTSRTSRSAAWATWTQPLYLRLARRSQQRASQGNLGLVVGATAPHQLADVRGICPDLPLLIPGIGAQGGDLADSVRCGVDARRASGRHQRVPLRDLRLLRRQIRLRRPAGSIHAAGRDQRHPRRHGLGWT